MFDKLAEELKNARIINNLTIKQLASRIRIDIKFLEAMEEGNFSFLPEIYVKAFIKEYANVVGLDIDIMLKKYEAAKEGLPFEEITENKDADELEKETVNSDEEENFEEKSKEKTEQLREVKHSAHQSDAVYSQPVAVFDSTFRNRNDSKTGNRSSYIIGALIGGVIIVFGLIYLIFLKGGNEIVVSEKPYDEVIAESQQRYEEKPDMLADSLQNRPAASDSLSLLIQTTDTSWVRIISDNSKEEEFILFPNSQKSFKAADNFNITFGRSSAIKLRLNDKPLPFDPRSKTVSYVMIDSAGLTYLHKPPAKGDE
jgi:cytoskeletal protein RodZ